MAYHAVRISVDVERGAAGGPEFKTTVIALAGGGESRNQERTYARQKWDISYGIMDATAYQEVRNFFYARRGRAHAWLFKDWTDYTAEGQVLGTGNGVLTQFQLVKTYENAGPLPYSRKITKPVTGTLVVYAAGTPVDASDYTVSSTGLITFDVAVGNGVVVTADFEFDVVVRFDADHFILNVEWVNAASVPDIPIIELIDEG